MEAVNQVVEMYLRCVSGDCPKQWLFWLSWAEFCYNTGFHSSLRTTPFEVVYGRAPPRLLSCIPGLSKVEAVDHELTSRDTVWARLHSRLLQAQNSMKTQYDENHRDVSFEVGDHVLLRLQLTGRLRWHQDPTRSYPPGYMGLLKSWLESDKWLTG